MTLSEFNQFKNEINKYIGKRIKYNAYVPSADRWKEATGEVVRLDEWNKNCVILKSWRVERLVHYKYILNY